MKTERPFSTGEAARVLGVTEPQLAETVRRGKIDPAPPVVAGRRLWGPEHVRQVARLLGRDEGEILAKLAEGTHAP